MRWVHVIRDHLMDTISGSLTPSTITTMQKKMAEYIDANSEVLLTLDFSRRYSFGDDNRAVIYTAVKVPEEVFEQEIRDSKQINNSNKIQSNPFYCACMLTMSALMNKKKPDEKTAKQIMVYMSLQMYTSIHSGFFKYNANKQVMDYTIAHLDNSFRVRSMPSLFAFLTDNAGTAFETYRKQILRCNDDDITWVVNALWDRVKGKMRKIANKYYENHESGNYLNADTDSVDPNNYHEADNNSFMIDRLSNKIYIKLLNHQFDDRFLKYAITRSDTSYQRLKNLVDDIIVGDTTGDVRKFISSMIEYFLLMSGYGFEMIPRGEFVSYMKGAYASNTNMEQMVFIKTQLETWLDDNMVSVGRTRYGSTAKQGYKKAIYMFFVFVINHESKTN
ncbi:hypothetical protein [uncultured Duncaniella sp.]|uniref:hypothetical protein n=1 Tax=uncultured Duncaniella sp. TaxID=2768039 RepID=UPI00262E503E|nr:hypothetical protein [uncultured Duncaniella sp.]